MASRGGQTPLVLIGYSSRPTEGTKAGLEVERPHTVSLQNEEGQKRAVWENNMKMINLHNKDYQKGKHGFSLEMNAFGDLVSVMWILEHGPSSPIHCKSSLHLQ